MKKFFKRLIYLVLIIAVGAFGYNQYSNWVTKNDLAEQSISPQGKLPDNLTPTHYDLSLRIDPDDGTFSGQVEIKVTLNDNVNELWLHSKDLDVSNAKFVTAEGNNITLNYKEMGHSGVARLQADDIINAQNGVISLSFSGDLANDLGGLYKIEDGGLSYAFTQFEATDARRAFPSFDEPRFKTPFDIQLEVKIDHQGITNTPQINQENLSDGYKRLTFKTTKPLPTYLLAFVVGEVDIVKYANIPNSVIRDREVPLRGIATKGKGKDLEYALANTADILGELESYFGMPYPYEKLDIVAVPDFRAGAMENAGLITYREQLLLLGDSPSLSQQRSYASVHAHELAHQWFGNLVTMRWWDDLWLNESFATWMANVAMQKWNPDFGFDRGMVHAGHRVMNQDLYADTRQIREPIKHSSDIESAFDGITYSKGGAMLQMFEAYVGKENFQKGVRFHMKKYAFGHADADEFLDSIQQFSTAKNIKQAFNSFLNQTGVPLVEVEYQCLDNSVEFSLNQKRYLPVGARSSAEQIWSIPVCLNIIGQESNSKHCLLMTEKTTQLSLDNTACPLAVMPNADGKGYFRWTLNSDDLSALLTNRERLSASEKYSLASTLAAEFDANRLDVKSYLEAIEPFASSNDWDLVTQPVGMIKFISENIATGEEQKKLQKYLSKLYQSVLERVGLNPDTEFDKSNPNDAKMLRDKVLKLMAMELKQPELLNELSSMASAYIGYKGDNKLHPEAIDSETIGVALASGVDVLGMPFVDSLLTLLDETDDGTLRERILVAIAMSEDPEISDKVLDLITSFSLRVNERITLLVTHMRRKNNSNKVYQWFKGNFDLMAMIIPKRYLSMSPLIASDFCSKEMHEDVNKFFSAKIEEIPGLERNLSQTLERIEICSAVVKSQIAKELSF